MKNSWKTKKLGEICELINRGISPKYTDSEGLCVLNQKCIRNHEINFDLSRLHDFNSKKVSSDKLIQIGDVLVNSTGTGTLGRVAQVKEVPFEATVDSHVTIVRPIKNMFYPPFFGYALIFIEEEISKRGDGCGGQTELARTTLKNDFEITYPESLSEQQRIVAILDKTFATIDKAKFNARKNLQNTLNINESTLNKMVSNPPKSWKINKISEIFTIRPPKKEARDKLSDEDFVSFVPMEDLGILTKELIATKEKKLKEVSGSYTYFSDNDVLLAKITPCFENGKLGIARNLKNGVGFGSSEYIVFRSNGELIPDFLYYFLAREQFRQDGKKVMSGAVGHKRVATEFIENLKIPYPESLEKQHLIVAKLDELSNKSKILKCKYQNKLNCLNELKKSILQKAFSGELTTKTIDIDTQVQA